MRFYLFIVHVTDLKVLSGTFIVTKIESNEEVTYVITSL